MSVQADESSQGPKLGSITPLAASKRSLEPLPGNESEYWEGAEIHGNITPQPVVKDNNHYFIRKSGREAECTHCNWGFALDPGDKIEDGHLFDGTGKLIL